MKEENELDIIEKNQDRETFDQTIAGENIYYKSEQIAPLLGLDSDQIRYRAREYEEFLHTSKTKGGHLRFTDYDVERLRTIQHLMNGGYSKEEIKALLRNPESKIIIPGKNSKETEEIKTLLAQNEYTISRLTAVISDVVSKAFTEQSALLHNQKLIEEEKHADEINALKEQLNSLAQQNNHLAEQLAQITIQLSNQEKENKKGFWGLFRK